MKPLSVLIVEDEPEMAENLAEVLDALGASADVAHSAEAALELLGQGRYAGVITDQRLPGRPGVELIREMRQRQDPTPVVVLTAFADTPTEQAASDAGALDVLTKPLDIGRLLVLLHTFDRTDNEVLVVDDSTELADNVADALVQHGFEVAVAHSAEEALARRTLPRVAVLDIRLPDGSGLELARRLAARDPNVRIVFVSGFAEQHLSELLDLQRTVRGVDGSVCLSKPYDMVQLVHAVRQVAGLP